jgi:hypothetical protein
VRDLYSYSGYFNEMMDTFYYGGELKVNLPAAAQEAIRRSFVQVQEGNTIEITDEPVVGVGAEVEEGLLLVRVIYDVCMPTSGVQFVVPAGGVAATQVFTTSAHASAAAWFPCIDNDMAERSTFDLEITCPVGYVVVASGELEQQVFSDATETTVTFMYSCKVPILARCLGLAVGPYHPVPDHVKSEVTHFITKEVVNGSPRPCSPKAVEALHHSVANLPTALDSFTHYLNSHYPHPSYQQVFVEGAFQEAMSFAGMTIFSSALLHGPDLPDQAMGTLRRLSYGLAYSWASTLCVASVADLWVMEGVASILSSLHLQHQFGSNFQEFSNLMDRLLVSEGDSAPWRRPPLGSLRHRDDNACVLVGGPYRDALDERAKEGAVAGERQGIDGGLAEEEEGRRDTDTQDQTPPPGTKEHGLPSRPLCWEGCGHSSEMYSSLMRRKAGLVMGMLQTILTPSTFQGLVKQVMSESGERHTTQLKPTHGALTTSTKKFVKKAKKKAQTVNKVPLHNKEVERFAEHWVICDGYPDVTVTFDYNKKKKQTEITCQQDMASQAGLAFTAPMLLCVHEDYRAFDHVMEESTFTKGGQAQCTIDASNRLRRNRKRKKAEETTLSMDDLLCRYNETPVRWVRVDPGGMWMRPMRLEVGAKVRADCPQQDEVFWISQLSMDRDVVAQYEAIQGLARVSRRGTELLTFKALHTVLQHKETYHRVRAAAAYALATACCRQPACLTYCMDILLTFVYSTRFALFDGHRLLRSNDFSDLSEAMLHRAVPYALSEIVHESGYTPAPVLELLLNLLTENENATNVYSDDFYVAVLLRALGNVRTPLQEQREKIKSLLLRHLELDQVIPSYRHVISKAVVETICLLQLRDQTPEVAEQWRAALDLTTLLRSDRPVSVRVAAFRAQVALLLGFDARAPAILPVLLDCLEQEEATVNFLPELNLSEAWELECRAMSSLSVQRQVLGRSDLTKRPAGAPEAFSITELTLAPVPNFFCMLRAPVGALDARWTSHMTQSVYACLPAPATGGGPSPRLWISAQVTECWPTPTGGESTGQNTRTLLWSGEPHLLSATGFGGWMRLEWLVRVPQPLGKSPVGAPLASTASAQAHRELALVIAAEGLVAPLRLQLCAPQLEPKPYATPFCVRTRSANPGTRIRFARIWADACLQHPNCLAHFQHPTPANRDLVERLWRLITLSVDHRFNFQCARLYRCLWGHLRPSAAGPSLDGAMEREAQTALQRRGQYSQDRIQKAKNSLYSAHAKRRTDFVLKVSLGATVP